MEWAILLTPLSPHMLIRNRSELAPGCHSLSILLPSPHTPPLSLSKKIWIYWGKMKMEMRSRFLSCNLREVIKTPLCTTIAFFSPNQFGWAHELIWSHPSQFFPLLILLDLWTYMECAQPLHTDNNDITTTMKLHSFSSPNPSPSPLQWMNGHHVSWA